MRHRLRHLLTSAGLREDETMLYLLLLKKRRASMSELIAGSGLNMMTAYRTMKRLRERGLVQATRINRKQNVYAPLTLQKLIEKIDREQRKMRKLQLALQGLDGLLPYMDLSSKDADDEPVEVREGLDAFREEYLKLPHLCTDEFLCMGSMQNYWDVAGMSDESPEEIGFRSHRLRHGIYCRVFNTPSPEADAFSKRDSRELRTTRIVGDIPVSKDYLGFTADRVCHFICDEENPRVIIIRHPELVALHRNQFQQMWERGMGA